MVISPLWLGFEPHPPHHSRTPRYLRFLKIICESGVVSTKSNPASIAARADMVFVDLEKEVTITNDDQITACGWTPYDGLNVKGWMTRSIIRGEVVLEDGRVLSRKGFGRFVSRAL